MTPHGSIALSGPDGTVAASYLLPDNDKGCTVLSFDLGNGTARLYASTPSDTAAWLEQLAALIRQDAKTASVHHITKAA